MPKSDLGVKDIKELQLKPVQCSCSLVENDYSPSEIDFELQASITRIVPCATVSAELLKLWTVASAVY